MKKLPRILRFMKEKYTLLSLKRYNTLAGTLVFFFIMSIVPLAFWLSLVLGKLPVDAAFLLNLPVFDSVKNVITFIQNEAQSATAGASIFLMITTLYSSTNFFYQMRKSGEIIYGFSEKKAGLKVRLGALLLLFYVLFLIVVCILLFALGMYILSKILPLSVVRYADYGLLIGLSFLLVLLLNFYVCPYKVPVKNFIVGALITVLAWFLAAIGFSIYLKLSNMDRLYGALSAVIVFLLWLYVLMLGFVGGVIFNSEQVKKGSDKKL